MFNLNMDAITKFLGSDKGQFAMAQAGKTLNPDTAPIANMVQQNIQTENQMDLMKRLLGGQVPGGKATFDEKGMKLEIPQTMLQEGMNAPEGVGPNKSQMSMTGKMSTTPQLQQQQQQQQSAGQQQQIKDFASMLGGGYPFDSSQLSGADLTGLTPEHIQGAMNTALAVKAMQQQQPMNAADIQYKRALTQQALSQAQAAGIPEDERTTAVKNYEYAVNQGFEGSFKDFQETAKTSHQKDYERAKAEGYGGNFHEWLLEMNESQRDVLSIGEKTTQREKAKSAAYLQSPEFHEDLEDYLASDEVQNQTFMSEDPNAREKVAINWMLNKVRSIGADPLDFKWEGDTLTINYKTKDGKKESISYGF